MDAHSLRRILGIAQREPHLHQAAVTSLDEMLDAVEAQIADLQAQRARIVRTLVELNAADPATVARAEAMLARLMA